MPDQPMKCPSPSGPSFNLLLVPSTSSPRKPLGALGWGKALPVPSAPLSHQTTNYPFLSSQSVFASLARLGARKGDRLLLSPALCLRP